MFIPPFQGMVLFVPIAQGVALGWILTGLWPFSLG
jgi:hypothetical protein